VERIAILPTLLTLGNAVCGFASITFASQIRLDSDLPGAEKFNNLYLLLSGSLILAAMVFDALDGYVARLSKSSSEFGGQLDSLCDAISFGVAPAFLLMHLSTEWGPMQIRQGIVVIATLYMACALLRLARFNLQNNLDPASHKRFKGLPSPAAAGCLASLAILRVWLPTSWPGVDQAALHSFVRVFAPLGALVVALLMVSSFPYPHFTNQLLRRRRRFSVVVQAVLVVAVVVVFPDLALFLMFWAYALHAPLRTLVRRALHHTLPAHDARLD
jgi:CDP-diacylglycerol--serine O-phosphatidyltransferase